MSERITREEVMAATLWLHDIRYGIAHCERKWIEICPRYVALIFEASERLRTSTTDPTEETTP